MGDLGELALKENDVEFEVVSQSHLHREEVVTTPLASWRIAYYVRKASVTFDKL